MALFSNNTVIAHKICHIILNAKNIPENIMKEPYGSKKQNF
jgi:hypothetical protein